MSFLFIVGWLLAGLVSGGLYAHFAITSKRPRALLATGLVIAALVYVALGIRTLDPRWIALETVGLLVYGGFAWAGLRRGPEWLAAGWMVHVLWDIPLHLMGPGEHLVPSWYALACLSFDLVVAGYIVRAGSSRVVRASEF